MSTQIKARTSVYLSPRLAGTLMTPEEFDAVRRYKNGYRYELVHGVLVVSPIPLPGEASPNELLGGLLYVYQLQAPGIIDITMPQQYVHTATGRRIADRAIWIGLGRLPDLSRDAPTIAVEFVSGSRRDRQRDYVDKRREYIAAGVAEYWIVDRFSRTLTIVRPSPSGPQDQIIAEDSKYTTPLLPGFELALAPLLAVADRWAAREEGSTT